MSKGSLYANAPCFDKLSMTHAISMTTPSVTLSLSKGNLSKGSLSKGSLSVS
jgi:hypothetical protein